MVRQLTGLKTHSTRDIIFCMKQEDDLGVLNIKWTYFATRLVVAVFLCFKSACGCVA